MNTVPDNRPSTARIYDYLLGGYQNFAVDRAVAERIRCVFPHAPLVMQVNRAFLRRVVRFLAQCGIDQFLDLGSGIPTAGNVHEVAQALNPSARVVYVDCDPVAVQHSNAVLADNERASAVEADIRDPAHVLRQPSVLRLLDSGRPVAVLLIAVLHFVANDAVAHELVRTFRAALAPGSYMVFGHGTNEHVPDQLLKEGQRLYAQTTTPARPRARAEIVGLFDELDLVEPGLVWAPLWRPERPDDLLLDRPEASMNLVGVGRVS